MSRKIKIRRNIGDIISIPLYNGNQLGFGILLEEPLIAFFDLLASKDQCPSIDKISCSTVLFKVWVMNNPILDGSWPIIGNIPISNELLEKPWFFKEDSISGKITIGRTGSEELSPQLGQIETLERAAVWSAVHIVDRLQDYFIGKPNKWVELMKPKILRH